MGNDYIMHYGVKGMHWGVIRYRSAYNRFTTKPRIGIKRWYAGVKKDHTARRAERAAEKNIKLQDKKSKIDYKLSTRQKGYTMDEDGMIRPVMTGNTAKLRQKSHKMQRKIARNMYTQQRAERLIAQMDTDKKLQDIPAGVITTGEGIYSKYAAVRLYGNKVYIGTQRKVERKTRHWEKKKILANAVVNKIAKTKKG